MRRPATSSNRHAGQNRALDPPGSSSPLAGIADIRSRVSIDLDNISRSIGAPILSRIESTTPAATPAASTDMSLLSGIGGAIMGGLGGFAKGGITGAAMGAVSGAMNQSANVARGRGMGNQLAMQNRNSLVGLPSTNTFSASRVVGTRGIGGGAITMQMPGVTYTPSQSFVGSNRQAVWGNRRPPAGGFDANGWPLKANGKPYKRYRSMNPLNGRAARRAIRRIRGARKMLMQIERSMPKARTHRAPARRAH